MSDTPMMNETTAAAHIATAYLRNHRMPPGSVAPLVATIAETVRALTDEMKSAGPAVDPKRSVFNGHITCLECGLKMLMLRRHLRTAHGLEPHEYLDKWNLPPTYPLTAPNYSKVRSDHAKRTGLGLKHHKRGRGRPRKS